ncbi:39S ribosomal protein L1, mitochondrial-like [Mizuhopecten yessoensis]|uniref:39S ribosomal protein L1, mitochondrial n=1 Tax=Mizuhopecten yessoensis TaxID=6573 RepID=A0A210QM80_MIZYE|nr:39S ribosomal protein L1, mitochondrial-like [Mizuhopecten yessoensis]OWF49840.1 39S ribosomal protein L1, mitochondrial [Mizuhopecten yessoensis]
MAAPMRKHGTAIQRLYVALTQAWTLESRATTGVFHSQTRNASSKTSKAKKSKKTRVFAPPVMQYMKSPLLSTHIGEEPKDNVWFTSDYPEPYFTFEEAIKRHKLMAQPNLYDYMDSYVFANMVLSSWTNREGNYTSLSRSVVVPHPFEQPKKARCAVFTKHKDNVRKAIEAGALHAGGTELLAQIQTDQISVYELDHILSTTDMFKQLKPMRPLFGEMFPTEKNGNLSEDIPKMMEKFLNGVLLKIEQTKTRGVANIKFPIGPLSMTLEQLSDNLETLKKEVHKARPLKVTGIYVLQLEIEVPPSPTVFKLDPEKYDSKELLKKKH